MGLKSEALELEQEGVVEEERISDTPRRINPTSNVGQIINEKYIF